MSELSQTLKDFIVQFEQNVLPLLNNRSNNFGEYPVTCFVSSNTLRDPQIRELLGIGSGNSEGRFMGVAVRPKPDMTVEYYGTPDDK